MVRLSVEMMKGVSFSPQSIDSYFGHKDWPGRRDYIIAYLERQRQIAEEDALLEAAE